MLNNPATSTEGQSDSATPLSKFFHIIEQHLFSHFYRIRQSTSICSVAFVILQWLVVTFQLCHFISDKYVAYHWNSHVAGIFNSIANFVSHFPGIDDDIASFHAACAVVYGCIALYTTSALSFYYFQWKWPLVITYHALQFSSTTFFIPTASIFVEAFFGCTQASPGETHPFFPNTSKCWSEDMFGISLVSLFLLFLLLFISLLTQSTLFPTDLPQDLNGRTSFLSRHLNRAECAGLVCKVSLLILFTSARGDTWRIPLSFMLLLGGVVMTSMHVFLLEPFHDTVAALYITQWLLVAWSGGIALLMSFEFDAEGVGMLFFIGIPLIFMSSFFLVHYRYRYNASLGDRQFTNGRSYILFCRSLMRSFVKQHGRFDAWVDTSTYLEEKRRHVYEIMEVSLAQGMSRFPECARLRTFRVYFFLFICPKPVLALQELAQLTQTNSSFDVNFFAYALRMQEESSSRHELCEDIEKYLEFIEKHALADQILSSAARSLVLFWNELLQSKPSVDTLADIGHDARLQLAEAMHHYEKLLEMNNRSVSLLQTIGLIHLYLTGQTYKATEMLERAETLELQHNSQVRMQSERAFTSRERSSLDIFDEANAVIQISIADHDFSLITEACGACLSLFGFPHISDMVGKSINTLMPPELAEMHDSALHDFANGLDSRVINHVRTVFGQHQVTGYLIPLRLYVRRTSDATLVGVMQPLDLRPNQAYITIDRTNDIIYSATMEFYSLFGYTRKDVLAGHVRFTQALPGLLIDGEHDDMAFRKMASESGFRTQGIHAITGRKMFVQVYSLDIKSSVNTLSFVRLDVTQINEVEEQFEEYEVKIPKSIRLSSLSPRKYDYVDNYEGYVDKYDNYNDDNNYNVNNDINSGNYNPTQLSHINALPRTNTRINNSHTDTRTENLTRARTRTRMHTSPPPSSSLPHNALPHSISSPSSLQGNPESRIWNEYGEGIPNLPSFSTSFSHSADDSTNTYTAESMTSNTSTSTATTTAIIANVTTTTATTTAAATPIITADTITNATASLPLAPNSHNFSPSAAAMSPNTRLTSSQGSGILQKPGFLDILRIPGHDSHPNSSLPTTPSNSMQNPLSGSERHDNIPENLRKSVESSEMTEITVDKTKSARYNRAERVHKRLQKAIHNDDVFTERKLRVTNVYSILLIAVTMTLATVLFIITSKDKKEMDNVYNVVYDSSVRSAYLTATIPSLITYLFAAGNPEALEFQYNPYVHTSMDHDDIVAFERNYYLQVIGHLADISASVDRTDVVSFTNEIHDLRHRNTLKMEQLYGGKPRTIQMSLKEAFTSCSAAGQRVAWLIHHQGASVAENDMSFWWMMANGNQRLREASRLLTSLLLLAFADYKDRVVIQPVYFLVASVVVMCLVLWFKMRPVVMRIEDGKTEVLEILLDIPKGIRRALRRKALIVYEKMKKSGDVGAQVQAQVDEDEDDAAQASKDLSALENLSSDENDTFERYAHHRRHGSELGKSVKSPLLDKFREQEHPLHPSMTPDYNEYSGMGNGDGDGVGTGVNVERATGAGIDIGMGTGVVSYIPHMSVNVTDIEGNVRNTVDPENMFNPNNSGNPRVMDNPVTDDYTFNRRHRATTSTGAAVDAAGVSAGTGVNSHTVTAGTIDLRALTVRLNTSVQESKSKKNDGSGDGATDNASRESILPSENSSLFSRRALRTFYVKYFIFIMLVIVYFVTVIFVSHDYLSYQDGVANLFISSARRLPMLKTSWHITRLHLYTNYTHLSLTNPDSPYIRAGNYINYGKTLLKNAEMYNREAVFGTEEIPAIDLPELRQVLYEDACNIPRKRFEELDIEIDDYFFLHCHKVANGVLKRGFYSVWLEVLDMIGPLLTKDVSNYISYFLNPTTLPPTLSLTDVKAVLARINIAGELINHYITPLVRAMNSAIHEHGLKIMKSFTAIRTGLFIAYLGILLMLYFLVLYPTSKSLSRDASETKSLFLLLHPDIVKQVPALQQYIAENITLE